MGKGKTLTQGQGETLEHLYLSSHYILDIFVESLFG